MNQRMKIPLLIPISAIFIICFAQADFPAGDLLSSRAFAEQDGQTEIPLAINEFMASNSNSVQDPQDQYDDWVEIHNYGIDAIDIGGMYLTDDLSDTTKWRIPANNTAATTIPAGGYLLIWADNDTTDAGLHANFKLSADGEEIGLFDSNGITLIDSITFGNQVTDISYGRYPDAGEDWRLFTSPSPAAQNEGGYLGEVADTKFSHNRGFYVAPFSVTIATETDGAVIYYTLDGSDPFDTDSGGRSANAIAYTGPIPINKTTYLRAKAVKTGFKPSEINTQTFIFLDDVLQQPRSPSGFPSSWGGTSADYEMDPDIVQDPRYNGMMKDALLSIPSMSLVMTNSDLFDSGNGIYANPNGHGVSWERPGSMELIYPDGTDGVQVDCGIRIQGGAFRSWGLTKKKSFRLLFKGIYGPTKLRYPLFGEDAVDQFDTVVLRGGANDGYSWNSARYTEQYTRDEFGRSLQRATGNVGSHGTFVHLYINGLYWGLYNPCERPDDAFSASYYGGEKEDWDSIHDLSASSGDTAAWNQMISKCRQAAYSDEAYHELQGNNPDGTPNPAYPNLLDVTNYIDYLIVNLWGGNWDWPWKNWWAGRDRTINSTGFKFYCWDYENTMGNNLGRSPLDMNALNNNFSSAGEQHENLSRNSEYRMFFADRVHRFFFNNGILTSESLIDRYTAMANEIEMAIVTESARWGDEHHSTPLTLEDWYDRDSSYNDGRAGRDWILNYYIPQRSDIVLQQFRNAGLYPDVDATVFYINDSYQHGGYISPTDRLSMNGPGQIYFTLDGTEPHLTGLSEHATTSAVLVAENADKRVLVPTSEIGNTWRSDLDYDDSSWMTENTQNGALEFDGLNDFVDVDDADIVRGSFTLAMWLRYDVLNTLNAVMHNDTWDAGSVHVHLRDSSRVFDVDINGGKSITTQTALQAHQWYHITATIDVSSGQSKVYVNGVLDATSTSGGTATPYIGPMNIGAWLDNSRYFTGAMDDIRIYSRILNVSEVRTLANFENASSGLVAHWKFDEISGNLATDSAGSHHGVVYGNAVWVDGPDSGPGGVGYEVGSGYEDYISLDVKDRMYDKYTSCYIRIPFFLSQEPDHFNIMTLRIRYDDGFIAYLNGVEVARRNFTGTPDWNSTANPKHSDSEAVNFEDIDISQYLDELLSGDNILAIHGLNQSLTSSDFLISTELDAYTDDSSSDVDVSTSAIQYIGPITLTESTHVKARVLDGGTWSALNEATYAVGPVAENLRITELMYHPLAPADANDPNEEFIELTNIGTETINLNLVKFANGIDFTFPSIDLAPGEFVLVVQDIDAFEARYGTEINIAGQYTGKLNNAGEKIRLEDAIGQTILEFSYKDGWRSITDGEGFSLTIIDATNPGLSSWDEKDSWRPSAYAGGSPGQDDSGILPNPGDVVINELLANSPGGTPDWIELCNTTGTAIDISGWFLSDSNDNLFKYEIANGTTIGPNGYFVLYEDPNFGNTNDPASHEPFALSENGERLYLCSAQNDVLTGYRNVEDFGASETGVSFGRYYKASTGNYNFVAMDQNTPGSANSYPKVGPIAISEIMYNPDWPEGGSYTNDQYEYIELKNISAEPVTLHDYDKAEPWKFTDGVDFTFGADNPVTIPAGGYLLVVKNPAAFSWRYPAVPAEIILGPYEGNLSNAGESLELGMPGDVGKNGQRQYIRIDRINYSDGSHPENCPGSIDLWPVEADGNGMALTRKVPVDYGNEPENWTASAPSPGE